MVYSWDQCTWDQLLYSLFSQTHYSLNSFVTVLLLTFVVVNEYHHLKHIWVCCVLLFLFYKVEAAHTCNDAHAY